MKVEYRDVKIRQVERKYTKEWYAKNTPSTISISERQAVIYYKENFKLLLDYVELLHNELDKTLIKIEE